MQQATSYPITAHERLLQECRNNTCDQPQPASLFEFEIGFLCRMLACAAHTACSPGQGIWCDVQYASGKILDEADLPSIVKCILCQIPEPSETCTGASFKSKTASLSYNRLSLRVFCHVYLDHVILMTELPAW